MYLDEICGDNHALRNRVEALLRANANPGDFLDGPACAVASIDLPPLAEKPGTRIGPYKLCEQIGVGGFGIVYLAEQKEPVSRKVALKIIKPGMDTRDVIARFGAERQALAVMDHPNIARVFDAGATATGRPYFVMELVKGRTITEYCDEQKLSTRERLQLFIDVCRAVQHAHQKGIIHRDIKPSNVMVTVSDGKPIPKVIDFGVSKALRHNLVEDTIYTADGQMVGTPLYMAPEQAAMSTNDVDIRSDVYSLGVLLYELLTGTTLFDKETLKHVGFDELRRIIREDEPPRPSSRVSTLNADTLSMVSDKRKIDPRRLGQTLRGELDWIVMKALEKDRDRRYESANAFANDVGRFLNDEAVQAKPSSSWYRLKKVARRNKARLAAASVMLLAVMVASSVVGWALHDRATNQEELERKRIERQTRLTNQVQLLLDESEQLMGELKWPEALATADQAKLVLQDGEADIAVSRRMTGMLNGLRFVEELEQIRLQRWTIVFQGEFDPSADQLYANAFRKQGIDLDALPLEVSIRKLNAQEPFALAFAMALDDWAEARELNSSEVAGDWKRIVAVARGIDRDPIRDQLRKLGMQKWTIDELQVQLRELMNSVGIDAQPPMTAVRLSTPLFQANLPETALQVLFIAQRNHPKDFWLNIKLSQQLIKSERYGEAIRYAMAAVSIRPNSALARNGLGACYTHLGNRKEAIACYRKAVALDPKNAMIQTNLGAEHLAQGAHHDAILCFRKAIEFDPKHGRAHYNLGLALSETEGPDEEIACYRKAIESWPTYINPYVNLGSVLQDLGKVEEATTYFEKAIELDPNCAMAHNGLGYNFKLKGSIKQAIAHYRKAIEIDSECDQAHFNLGNAMLAQRQVDEAVASFRQAVKLNPRHFSAQNNLGDALQFQGRLEQAASCYQKAIEINSEHFAPYNNLGMCLLRLGKLEEAITTLRRAVECNPRQAPAQSGLGMALCQQGKWEEGMACFRKAIEIDPKLMMARRNLAKALVECERYDEAIQCYRKAIDLAPDEATTRDALAWLLCTAKDHHIWNAREALSLANELLQKDPRNRAFQRTLGVALYRNGDWNSAVTTLQKLQDSEDPAVLFFLAMSHWQTGNKARARECYRLGVAPMQPLKSIDAELSRFRAETERLIGIKSAADEAPAVPDLSPTAPKATKGASSM